MTDEAIASAEADIESTTDLLERALKLSGLITSLFAERGFKLVIVGGMALVERVLFAYCPPTAECVLSARQMMAAAVRDEAFDWTEAERLAASPDFAILDDFRRLKQEVADGLAK